MKSLVQFLSSVKLAIVLIIIITVASILGTLIPQGRGIEEYALRYGQLAGLLERLQFTRLYQSFWYISLLILFSLNILVCTLTRLTPKLKRVFSPKLETEPNKLAVLKIKGEFSKKGTAPQAREQITEELKRHHYKIREKSEKDRSYLLARKKTSGLFGADAVHLGLLIILAGGIISGSAGLKSHLSFTEGETLPVPNANFQIRLDKFETEFYESGQVKDWISTLTVLEEGKELQTKIVEVNHPLSYKGYMFYQSGYDWDWQKPTLEIWAKQEDSADYIGRARLRLGERAELSGRDVQITALQFVPDFVIDENNRIATRSMHPNNPAVYIEGWQGETQVFSGWIFAKFPEFSRIHSEEETNLSFELRDYQGGQISVIQAAKDPGVNLIWIGCGFLMLGLGMAFYWPPREIKIIIDSLQNKTDIFAGGIAAKNKDAFQAEFENIMTSLRRNK
jgi:cytochrome c biogenesis protein